jgi:hypothetical protein
MGVSRLYRPNNPIVNLARFEKADAILKKTDSTNLSFEEFRKIRNV